MPCFKPGHRALDAIHPFRKPGRWASFVRPIAAMEPDFGIFEPVFESAHGYLALLGLSGDDAPTAVQLVRDCCRKVADPYPDICRLLADPNWRPHLIAAVAVIVSGNNPEAVRRLWHRIDTGSWVTPQIGVALFLIDRDFEAQSRSRLEAGCPVDATDLRSMTGIERHSAAGPEGTVERSAKTAATLIHLLKRASPPGWLESVRSSADMRTLLAKDVDGSEIITDRWLHRIQEITREAR